MIPLEATAGCHQLSISLHNSPPPVCWWVVAAAKNLSRRSGDDSIEAAAGCHQSAFTTSEAVTPYVTSQLVS